jgi:hypothetical protein
MWKNAIEPKKPQMTIWCMRIACWIAKATHTHTRSRSLSVCNTLLLLHCNNGCTNAPRCYVVRTYIARLVIFTVVTSVISIVSLERHLVTFLVSPSFISARYIFHVSHYLHARAPVSLLRRNSLSSLSLFQFRVSFLSGRFILLTIFQTADFLLVDCHSVSVPNLHIKEVVLEYQTADRDHSSA